MPTPLNQEQPAATKPPVPASSSVRLPFLLMLLFWLAFWALLSDAEGWGFGLPLALLASWLCLRLELRSGPLRVQHLPAFLWFFLIELCSGGWDVARRALHPRRPLAPAWVAFEMQTRDDRVQLLLSAMVGLLPGTLSSHFSGQTLHIHALDAGLGWQLTARRLEEHLSRLLGASVL